MFDEGLHGFATASNFATAVFVIGAEGGAAVFGGFEVGGSVGSTAEFEILHVLAKLATILPGARLFSEIFGAAVSSFVFAPAADSANGRLLDGFGKGGVDLARKSAGHLEERPGGEEWNDLDGDTHDEDNGVFGGGDDGPADEGAGAKEGGEHGVEEEHLGERLFPVGEPFFCVGKEVADEG